MIAAARQALEVSWKYYDELEQLGNQLVREKMDGRAFNRFMKRLMPLDPEIEPDSRTARNRDAAVAAVPFIFESAAQTQGMKDVRYVPHPFHYEKLILRHVHASSAPSGRGGGGAAKAKGRSG